jgi:single-stranded-DNA-specific exonuclease
MFLSKDAAAAKVLAEKLHRLNDDRRATEAEALRAIELHLDSLATDLPACFILDDAGSATAWHRGIIGILAARVVDRTGKPALVMTHEDGNAYGSGRSVSGFHLLDALTAVQNQTTSPLFSRFGGHAHAVGFTLPSTQVPELRLRLTAFTAAHQASTDFVDELECDAEVRLGELTPDLMTALEQLGPFGNGNPEPVFVSKGVRLTTSPKPVKDRHLRLSVEDPSDGIRFGGMAWSRKIDWAAMSVSEGWTQGTLLDLAYKMRRNWHPDFGGWELEILDLRSAESPTT